jgi:sugar diacid utilization regulator
VLAADGAEVVVLAQGDAEALAAALRARGTPAGLSEALAGPEAIAAGAAQARLALAVALGAPPDGDAVVGHAALDPAVALLGAASPEARARLRAALAPLAAQPRLRAAVGAYLAAGLDLGRAAHALGLHRNSLRYRLDRAELALGRSLRDTGTVATLHLALLAERLEATSDPISTARGTPSAPALHRTGEPDPIRLDSPARGA